MVGLVLAVLLPSATSVAVTVKEPLLFKVTAKVCVPAASAALGGSVAVESLEVMPTVSAGLLMRFQLASTEFTVTLNVVKALWVAGVPVLPLALSGAAVSPGTNNCNLTNAPALTATPPLVLAESVPAA